MNTPVRSSRRSNRPPRNKRLIAVLATLGVFGAIVAVTQVSNADVWGGRTKARACPTTAPPATTAPAATPSADASATPAPTGTASGPGTATKPETRSYHDHGAIQHPGDGQQAGTLAQRGRGNQNGSGNCTPSTGPTTSTAPGNPTALEPLGADCSGSDLQAHDGFQNGERCVGTEFGEVGAPEDNPSLLITQAPTSVRVNQQFTLRVSTRNLVRDRFLPAAQGGYYKESSFLTEDGLVRGHFHSACRMLTSNRNAPDPAPVPAFFVATEDGNGGATPDTVTVTVPGLTQRGQAQCAIWAGDGSHRIPMMARANQVPAFDVVRITVR
ncbi:Pecanex-like protein 1 [Plantactinospora solaniradicis]|uniref:Pecanex-like protein 1 n=1 Tax=Plantactinospora solaniradicis TaxID=1723736 RepID=A0ABW1K890_9ACTN